MEWSCSPEPAPCVLLPEPCRIYTRYSDDPDDDDPDDPDDDRLRLLSDTTFRVIMRRGAVASREGAYGGLGGAPAGYAFVRSIVPGGGDAIYGQVMMALPLDHLSEGAYGGGGGSGGGGAAGGLWLDGGRRGGSGGGEDNGKYNGEHIGEASAPAQVT